MLRDSQGFETQIIDAVRSVNRALGGATGSNALRRSDYNQYEVQLIDAIRSIGRTLSGKGLSVAGGVAGDLSGYATVEQFQDLSRRVTKLESESFFRLVDGNVTLKEEYRNLWVPGWMAAGGIGSGGGGGGGSSYLKELLDVYHGGNGVLRADGTAVVAGDALVYNSTLGWVAAPVSGGGGSSVVVTQTSASGVQTTTITVDGVPTSIPVTAVSFGTQASDKIPITIGATTKNVLTSHQSLSGYVPTSRQVNGHPLTADVTVTKGDLGLGNVENTKLSTWAGSQNITTLGTVSTGVWNGTAIGVTKGGTGLTSIAKGSLLYASSANVLSALAPNGTSTKKFLSQTGSNAPAWGTLSTGDITNIDTWIAGKGYALASDLTALSGTVTSLSSRVTSIEGWFEVVSVNGQSALHAKNGMAIYSDSWIASGGVGSGSGGGGGTAVAWGTKSGYTRPLTVEGTTETLLLNGALTGYATQTWVNNQGFLKTETDPTVPAWAKASTKPSYAFSEITNKPTTLSGYGITDALNKNTGGNISGDIYNIIEEEDADSGAVWVHEFWKITSYGEASFDSLEIGGVGINPGNLVTRSGAQTITGVKTFSGGIKMSGADIIPATDNTCKIGDSDYRFNQANIRNIYTSYFAFIDGDTKAFRGNFAIGNGYASINIAGSPSSHSYMFYDDSGFFFSGGGVPCGLSGHRWSKVWTVDADLSGSMALGGDIIPATDLGSQLGYSTRRFSNGCIRDIYTNNIWFRNSANDANTGLISFSLGYMQLRTGSNLDSSYKQLNFDETNGLYPYQSGVNLGYNGANNRWANIYGVNANLTGDLALASTSHIDIGPARIEYDATNGAIHVTTNQTGNNAPTIGFYADGFSAAGGIGSSTGTIKYVSCSSQAEYDAISPKNSSTIYTVGNPVTKIYLGTIQLYSEN